MAGFGSLGSLAAVEAHLWALGTFLYSAVAVASHCGERWERVLEWWRATMWAELAGAVAAVLSILPYYLSERGLPSVGIAADGSISRAGAKRVGTGGLGAVVLWVIVRRLAAGRRPRSAGRPQGQGEPAPGAQTPHPNMRVEDWLTNEDLGACAAVLGQLGYDQRIDMLMVRKNNGLRRFAGHGLRRVVASPNSRCRRAWCAYAGKRRRRVARHATRGVWQHVDPETDCSQV
jgi:hypothetical protein